MKRKLRYFLISVFSLVMLLSACFVFAGCNEDSGSDSASGVTSGHTVQEPPVDGLPKMEYTVTVLYPDNTPVYDVLVQFIDQTGEDKNFVYSSATTGSDGVAKVTASQGWEYIIRLDQIPEGYDFIQEVKITAAEGQKTLRLNVVSTGTEKYDVTVKSVGGLAMEGVLVQLKENGTLISSAVTSETGVANVPVDELKEYEVELQDLPDGYFVVDSGVKTSADGGALTVTVNSAVIPDSTLPSKYEVGDIMHDFSVTTSDNKTFTLSEVLKTHKLVLLNFWGTLCSPCIGEFDDMERAYRAYKDDVAIIALSIQDSMTGVKEFKSSYGTTYNCEDITFDMGSDISQEFYDVFHSYNQGYIPFTVLIDRYGRFSDCGTGGLSETDFRAVFDEYISDDYVQKVPVTGNPDDPTKPIEPEPDKPDVTMPDSAAIEVALNARGFTGTYAASSDESVWPWLVSADGKSIYAANMGHHRTTATIEMTANLQPGQFLAFDYKLNTEDAADADLLYVYMDGSKMQVYYGVTDGWQTCYVYTPLEAGSYTLTLSYVKDKDDSRLVGDEQVLIANMRTVTEEDIKEANVSVNIYRDASYGINTAEYNKTSNWLHYITPVMGDDGYYHVNSKDGPYLLANLMSATHYTPNSLTVLAYSDYFHQAELSDYAAFFSSGVATDKGYCEGNKSYSWLANNSNIPDFCPVDELLATVLDKVASNFKAFGIAQYYTENTWLEFCGYYDHYGVGNPIENPIRGICKAEAFEAQTGVNHVNVDRVLVPRGLVYEFNCAHTGVYHIYSAVPADLQTSAAVWVEEGNRTLAESDPAGDYSVRVNFEAGKTYYIITALGMPSDFGEFDFYIDLIGDSYNEFTYASDGTYTFADETYTEEIIIRNHGMHAKLGDDGYYHQILPDGTTDSGDTSYLWIDMIHNTNRFNYATLEELATGAKLVEELNGKKFFDFTAEDGVDYSNIVLEYVAEAKKVTEGDTAGMVKADARLVTILNKALARIDHKAEDSWFGLAYYYYHIGEYTPGN